MVDLLYRIAPGMLAILPAVISYYFYIRKHEENDKKFRLIMGIETVIALIVIYTILWMTNQLLNSLLSDDMSVYDTEWYLVAIFLIFLLIHILFVIYICCTVIVNSRSANNCIVYNNQSSAITDLKEDVAGSQQVRILAIRGMSYIGSDGDFNFIWDNKDKRIELILSDKDNLAIKMRSKLYLDNNEEYKKELDIIQNSLVEKHKEFQNLTYYTHNVDLSFRLIILDKQIYLSFFNDGIKASDSQMYKFSRDTQIYGAFQKYYKAVRRNCNKQVQ